MADQHDLAQVREVQKARELLDVRGQVACAARAARVRRGPSDVGASTSWPGGAQLARDVVPAPAAVPRPVDEHEGRHGLERELLVGHRLERQPVQRRDAELLDRGAVLGVE